MKIRYAGVAAFQERPVTGLDGLWQPNQAGDAEGERLRKLIGTGKFIDDELGLGEGVVTFTKTLTGVIRYSARESIAPRKLSTGRIIDDWSYYSAQTGPANNSALVAPPIAPPSPYTWTKVARITGTGVGDSDGAAAQCTPSPAVVTAEAINALGVWVYNPTGVDKPFSIRVFDQTAARSLQARMACPAGDGWQFIVAASGAFETSTLLTTDMIGPFRITERSPASSFPSWGVGEHVYFGPITLNPRGRSTFMLHSDDGYSANLWPASGEGYPTRGRSYLALAGYYGYADKLSAYIVPSLIGTAGYLTWDDLRYLRDSGVTIGSHTYSHPADGSNNGLRLLGPANGGSVQAIYDDVAKGRDVLVAAGFASAADHFALPQGGWDVYVAEAVARCGFKTVRGISTHTSGDGIAGFINSGGGRSNTLAVPNGFINILGSLQIDDAADLATRSPQIAAFVDKCISIGGVGSSYSHGLSALTAAKFDYLCSYLKSKERDGLIDVLSLDQYASGLY